MFLKQRVEEYVRHGWGSLTFLELLFGMGTWLHPARGILRDGESVTKMALYLQECSANMCGISVYSANKKMHPEFWYLIRHSLGHTVASFDYDYSKENMDFLSVSGFLLLISTLDSIWIWSESLLISSYFQFLITILQLPRLILYAILNMAPRALSLWAPDCGSWGIPCRGTSMRSYINPDGYVAYGFVARANMMILRFLGCLVKASKKFWT